MNSNNDNKAANKPEDINDMEISDDAPDTSDKNEDESMEPAQDLESKIDELEAALEKEKKEYLFLMAEFDNFRKRNLKERSELIKNAGESVLKGLLPIVDDFERGIDAARNSDDSEAIREGMELIYNKLVKYLEKNGVKAIESTGSDFDPELHEAIAMVPVEEDTLIVKVIDTPTK